MEIVTDVDGLFSNYVSQVELDDMIALSSYNNIVSSLIFDVKVI